ncbi:MAG: anthranilate phosphoribosyltransferase [Dehalococcoidia bacterium]|nr:anthranilate phosphoribosyltransferase [Dehalococcoidia bacterium]
MIQEAISRLVAGESLSQDEAAEAMTEIMDGTPTPAQFGAFVTALRLKGETVDEIAGCASIMRARAVQVTPPGPVVDTCGTGGVGAGHFNVSTVAAFVVAGTGQAVAKHGNRGVTRECGSADVLDALGTPIELTPTAVAQCLEEAGFGFMFAPAYHPAMKFAAPLRREIGIRTVFNILGPLTNPAGARAQVLGVGDAGIAERMAEALGRLGIKHALVVHGDDGLDELSISAPSTIHELSGSSVETYRLDPEDVGLQRAPLAAVKGGSPKENAAVMRKVLAGDTGPKRDIVLLNSAAALVAADRAADLREGITLAATAIDSGAASTALDKYVAVSQRLGAAAD